MAESNGDSSKRRRIDGPAMKVLSRDEYFSRLDATLEPMMQIKAMYNSLVQGVVTDPTLMSIPIHDHAIVRGHACFDTCTVAGGRLYRLDLHLDRHLQSITASRIPLPFGGSAEECKDRMRTIVGQTVAASGCRDASVRYYTSVGPGNFGVTPDGCTSAFYVVVYADNGSIVGDAEKKSGIKEYTVRDVPMKPPFLARAKTNNYLLNSLTSMSSKDRGGMFGILIDGKGNIAEAAVMNTTFVTADRRLITPTFDLILAGTTVRKILEVAQVLLREGVLSAVSQEEIPEATARSCVEMMLSGGDHHLIPVTSWDDKPVGSGEVGEVTRRIIDLVNRDIAQGSADHYEVPYSAL